MSLFDWFLVGHLVGDFVLQSDKMASCKPQESCWLLRHVAVYMIAMTVILVAYTATHPLPPALAVLAWLFILTTHILLDRRYIVRWWMSLIGQSSRQPWLQIVVDQVFHLITLAIVAQVLDWAVGQGGGP